MCDLNTNLFTSVIYPSKAGKSKSHRTPTHVTEHEQEPISKNNVKQPSSVMFIPLNFTIHSLFNEPFAVR